MSKKIKVGDLVEWEEGIQDPDGETYIRVRVTGTVKEIKDAQKVHKKAPQYKPYYLRKHAGTDKIKVTKFPVGTRTYLVEREGEPLRIERDPKTGKQTGGVYKTLTAVHESQVL